MKAKVVKVVLWPRRRDRTPRIVPFTGVGVEVITGRSQTGKSALIAIVDYCLGSSKCAIPTGRIRETTAWFGVVLKTPTKEILIARRNPEMQAETSEAYLEEGKSIDLPERLEDVPQTSMTAIVAYLNDITGLPALAFSGGDEGGYAGRPSFRDMAAFQFLPQHIVANPYTLFFKADTADHQQKLKNIFPLVLGAIDADTLEKRRELRLVEAELRRARGELEDLRQRGVHWLREFRVFYMQARELGLLRDAPNPTDEWTSDQFAAYLRPLPRQLSENPYPDVETGASSRMARELARLRGEETELAAHLEDRKRKLARIERLRDTTTSYGDALSIQADRLAPVEWFAERVEKQHRCPVCKSTSAVAEMEIRKLAGVLHTFTERVGSVESVHRLLDRERAGLRDDLAELENRLNAVRGDLRRLELGSEEARNRRQTLEQLHRLVGRIEQELTKYDAADAGSELIRTIDRLEISAAELREHIDDREINRLEREANQAVGDTIRHYAKILGVEDPDRPVRIDVSNLTLAITDKTGKVDHLWEIGSAANWMGYHLATLLALHEHFLSLRNSPVPQFLFIDQPTQAFFPERWSNADVGASAPDPNLDTDDTHRVRRVFQALSAAVLRTKKRLQIIVIDHVGETAWADIEHVHLVDRWRGDSALIPHDW
jgi:hypothetical protein